MAWGSGWFCSVVMRAFPNAFDCGCSGFRLKRCGFYIFGSAGKIDYLHSETNGLCICRAGEGTKPEAVLVCGTQLDRKLDLQITTNGNIHLYKPISCIHYAMAQGLMAN